ncbi:MAG: Gfo/Idh/MocA family oxidoreductase [Defluviitaleaceae bacterium]|nr:Gfo/Idh/MocA family oxidoreductase [Defluviitaleaceae bacterium]
MDKVRFGIIGVGTMGGNHVKSFLDNQVKDGVLTAVCDVDPKRLDAVLQQDKTIKTFDNATAMYKSGEIDAVLIATPHYFHPPQAVDGFNHNIHVMIEKPAGVYTKQVREMNEAAAKNNVVFGIMYQQRTNSDFQKMREMVQNGELGELKRTNWIITDWYRSQAYYNTGGWRATWKGEGGGVLLNQCPHNLDLWQWICGMPSKVTAFCHEGKWHNIEVEDDVTAYVEYPNGATGVFITCTADSPGTNRFEIAGNKGKLVYEHGKLEFFKLEQSERDFNATNKIMFGAPKYKKETITTDGKYPAHNGVLAAFVDKILGRGEMTAQGEEGINGLMVSNAMHLSSWLGKTIPLPLDEDLFFAELKKRYK